MSVTLDIYKQAQTKLLARQVELKMQLKKQAEIESELVAINAELDILGKLIVTTTSGSKQGKDKGESKSGSTKRKIAPRKTNVSHALALPQLLQVLGKGYTKFTEICTRVTDLNGHRLSKGAVKHHLGCAVGEKFIKRAQRGRYALASKGTRLLTKLNRDEKGNGKVRAKRNGKYSTNIPHAEIMPDIMAAMAGCASLQDMHSKLVGKWGLSKEALGQHIRDAVNDKQVVRRERGVYAPATLPPVNQA